jgi:hypothetical protein
MSGQQEMEVTSVMLSLDLDPRVVKALHECSETSGRTLEQVVECILSQHLEICCKEERQPVSVSSLTWDSLVPYARRLKIGTQFNLYDLMIRMHSDKGLSSLKISSAWHSAFAQWVRRNHEFVVERSPRGNLYTRVSEEQAPIPDRVTDAVPFIDRLTNTELLVKLKDAASAQPVGKEFTFGSLLRAMDRNKLPKRISAGMHMQFNSWLHGTRAFSSFHKKVELEEFECSTLAQFFIRRAATGEGD